MAFIGGVVVTHGNLATELVKAAQTIVGEIEIRQITAVSIGWDDDVDQACELIAAAIKSVNAGAGVLVLTDMFGGTPTNLAARFLNAKADGVEVVTGVNLPMIIKLAEQHEEQQETLLSLARRVRDQGQKNIYLASEVLTPVK